MTSTISALADFSISGKRLLIRQDLNVPIKQGQVASDSRIRASLPTIKMAREQGAKIMIMSHLGRPDEGTFDSEASLAPVAACLAQHLGQPVRLVNDYLDKTPELQDGEVVLLENVRFNAGEKANDDTLAKQYANLCDIYVMDAFGTAHRAQASTYGAGKFAAARCAGPLLSAELSALSIAMDQPKRPLVAIVGGAKVSTKLDVLRSLGEWVDQLVPGGGIANTFIAAAGHNVGKSLYEPDLLDTAKSIQRQMLDSGREISIPTDVVTAKSFSQNAVAEIKMLGSVLDDDMILDIGPETAATYADKMKSAGTILWNGPLGVFEFDSFSAGTAIVGQAIADSNGFSIAGGGDTLAAISQFDLSAGMSYISTGGGAFLEFLEGKTLPAVEMLQG